MTDPFSSIRRRPATAATYGRKAQTARRIAATVTAAAAAATTTAAAALPDSGKVEAKLSGVASSSPPLLSEESDSGSSSSNSEHFWKHRSAQSVLSKLDSLYESTKAPRSTPPANTDGTSSNPQTGALSSRAILDSTKDKWDLGEVSTALLQPGSPPNNAECLPSKNPSQQLRRAVRNNTDILVSASKSSTAKTARRPSLGAKAESAKGKLTKADDSNKPVQLKRTRSCINPSLSSRAKAANKAGTEQDFDPDHFGIEVVASPPKSTKTRNSTRSKPNKTKPVQKPMHQKAAAAKSDQVCAWDMGELLSSTSALNRAKPAKRRGVPALKISNRGAASQASSSPPSTPSRLIAGTTSMPGSSDIESESSTKGLSNIGFRSNTPKAQISNRRVLESIQGPSTATSKRLQKRAFSQNIVYTYGHACDEDELETEYGQASGIAGLLGANSQPLLQPPGSLGSTETLSSDGSPPAGLALRSAGRDLLDLADHSSSTKAASGGSFMKQIGGIMRGMGSSPADRAASCQQLAASLEQQAFRSELLHSKQWLPTLLQTMQRQLDDPAVVSTMMLTISAAFAVPTTMQTLVFDRQVLESVAEILKRTFESDILLLRRESDFASSQQFGCAVQICRSARRCGLLSDKAPLSTYNLALATLHSFTRSDDVGYLAMAALLRNEMRESGCLGLLVERLFGSSAPAFISSRSKTDADMSLSHFGTDCGMAGLKHRGKSSHASDGFNAATADDDDMWMDFDLPEESKGINTFSRPKQRLCRSKGLSSSDAGSSISSKDRQMLASEPDASKPTYASIALELEILRFCATASADNQDEILQADACIPSLLSTLAICQQVSMKAQGQQLVQALETAALVLQLLVNLSNSSPEFCARFNACRGLDVVVKSIVFVSQSMGTHQHRRNAECFSHRSGAIAGDASDLRYDILLITSALLTNIVEADPSSATRFGFIRQSPSCSLSERCYPECKCSARLSLVALLAQTFAACHAVPTSTDAAVAAGYLSVLLGFLMRELPSLRSTVLDYLPERQVAIVVSHIEQFIRVSGSISKHFNGLLGGFGKIPGLSLGLSGYDSSSRSIPKHSAAVLADDGSNATSSALARNSNISSGTAATPMDCSLQAIIDALNCM